MKWVKPWWIDAIEDVAGGAEPHSGPGRAAMPPSMPLAGRRTSQIASSRSIHQASPWQWGRSRFGFGAGKASGVPVE